jgi:hypothetical protein
MIARDRAWLAETTRSMATSLRQRRRNMAWYHPVPQNFNSHVHPIRFIACVLYVTEFFKKVTYNHQAQ